MSEVTNLMIVESLHHAVERQYKEAQNKSVVLHGMAVDKSLSEADRKRAAESAIHVSGQSHAYSEVLDSLNGLLEVLR
jgi:hypothetical protein